MAPAQTRTIGAMRAPAVVVVAVAAVLSAVSAGCGDSGGSDDLDRIDGPAQVDPDYRPLDEGPAPDTTGAGG